MSRNSKSKQVEYNPYFSWTIFLIALLHFSVYSIGVSQAPAKAFLLRETSVKQSTGFTCPGDEILELGLEQPEFAEEEVSLSWQSPALLNLQEEATQPKHSLVDPTLVYILALIRVTTASHSNKAKKGKTAATTLAATAF